MATKPGRPVNQPAHAAATPVPAAAACVRCKKRKSVKNDTQHNNKSGRGCCYRRRARRADGKHEPVRNRHVPADQHPDSGRGLRRGHGTPGWA